MADTLLEGLGHPQGPNVTDGGDVIFAETYSSQLVIHRAGGRAEVLFQCGSGPNAVILGASGLVYFTQNGGQAGDWRADVQRPPALEVLDLATGRASPVCQAMNGRPLLAPHDLAWGPDGSLCMTDSGTWAPAGTTEPSAIIAISPTGQAELILDTGHTFPSGIVVEADGTIYWVECYTRRLMRMQRGRTPQVICTLPEDHMPESPKMEANGNFWIVQGCEVSDCVVITLLPRTTPLMPKLRIKRSTVQWAASSPPRRKTCQIFRAPWSLRLSSQAASILTLRAASDLARRDARSGLRATARRS